MASSMSWTLSLYFFQKISRPGVRSNHSCRKTEENVKEQIHSGEEVIFSSPISIKIALSFATCLCFSHTVEVFSLPNTGAEKGGIIIIPHNYHYYYYFRTEHARHGLVFLCLSVCLFWALPSPYLFRLWWASSDSCGFPQSVAVGLICPIP